VDQRRCAVGAERRQQPQDLPGRAPQDGRGLFDGRLVGHHVGEQEQPLLGAGIQVIVSLSSIG
jgi:hypothetical protein